MAGLQYFTHAVDGQLYGAWYREVSPHEIEVVGVGLLELASYAGFSPEATAKSVLEYHVRQRLQMDAPMPSLRHRVSGEPTGSSEADDEPSTNDMLASEQLTAASSTTPPINPRA